MYRIDSSGNQRPIYENGGMRFDLASSDDENFKHRFEMIDIFGLRSGLTAKYHHEFMFPNEFNEPDERFLVQQFKHQLSDTDHSPMLSLKVENNDLFYTQRTIPSGHDPDESESDRIKIIRNKWYSFDLDVTWGYRVVDKPWTPHTKIVCNGQVIRDDYITNDYNITGDIVHRIGPYVWKWGTINTQTIYARL